jgi:hypothetical protein
VSEPEPLSVDDALDRLVNQFSDTMAFFRELIQNAIDAGSAEVEIDFEHQDGMLIVRVDDWGAGMTREIIESRLTRLFSSSKDGDRTKIGKFGIGFVSVFAIDPEAVSIDTSRDGEHWRIVFDRKRRFSLVRREQPVEGTKIEIYKRTTHAEYRQFRARAEQAIRYWCRHVEAEVRVAGQVINEPIDLDMLDTPIKIRESGDDELLVIGHPRDGQAFAGFYNRGLTLVEEELLPAIAFKASSPRLEHTLTRDDVVREAGFTRLMERVQELIATALCAEVHVALDRTLRSLAEAELDDEQQAWLEYLWGAAVYHARAEHAVPSGDEGSELGLLRSPSGRLLASSALRKPKQRRVLVARSASALTELFERDGHVVAWLPSACTRGRALLDMLAPATAPIETWCTALPARDPDEAARWQVLADAVARLLASWGAKLAGVWLGHFDYADSAVADRVAITQASFGELTLVSEAATLGTSFLASRRVVVLNADHPTIRSVAALAQGEPELAAYLAVKAFLLGPRLDAEVAEQLTRATFELRSARLGASA